MLIAMTKGGVIASRRRGNLGGGVLLEIASSLPFHYAQGFGSPSQ